jgi:hypothetical protein
MSNHHAAFWSDSPSTDERRYRITHHTRTERRGNRQRQQEQRKEDELFGEGPWDQPGEYRRPKEELEATRAERRWYEEKQQRQQELQYRDYTTWEEIDRWAVDPGRVPEPAWDSLEQCEEGYRRMELERQARRRRRKPVSQPQECIGRGGGGGLRERFAK